MRYRVAVGLGRLSHAVKAIGLVVAFALAAALALAPVAAGDKEKVQIVAADQALAKSALVRLDDLGNPDGWSGGPTKPTPPASFTCGSYTARQSDLVLTGTAANKWMHTGLQIDSESQVLRSERMVALDWQRTVTHPGVTDCLRRMFLSELPKGQKLVAFGPLAFPKVARLTAAFRGLIDVGTGRSAVRIIVDLVVVGAGRVELTLITTAPYSARAAVGNAEARLAQLMVERAQPGIA
jgi:hypothetical protein